MKVGKIVAISNMRVEILLNDCKLKQRDIVYTVMNEKTERFEVS